MSRAIVIKYLTGRTLVSILIAALPILVLGQSSSSCANFDQKIKATYNFRPALLSNSERDQKSKAMDDVWEMVKASPRDLLPCLRKALDNPEANNWFLFDGSNLLVSLDSSPSSKETQLRSYTQVNLEDVDLRLWVSTLASRGVEGFDVSEPGARWLSSPKATYFLPEHGGLQVDKFLGGLFIFGSMDENLATPALLQIANQKNNPGRETAISILLMQATTEALRGLRSMDTAGLPGSVQNVLRHHLASPRVITKRKNPKTTREQFLKAFDAFVDGDATPFVTLVSEVPDGERDVVAVIRTEDLPLVRKVRRRMIARANQHGADYYVTFTQILTTLILEPEVKQ